MTFLLINSNENSFVAYCNGNRMNISYSYEFRTGGNNQKAPDLLIHCLDKLIHQYKIDLSSIDAIAVTIGPGSFTGIRVGLSISKALGFSLNKKLIPVNNFELTLNRLKEIYMDVKYCILIKAKGTEFYYSITENENELEYGLIELNSIESFKEKCSVIVNDFSKESLIKLPYFEYIDISEFSSEADSMSKLAEKKYKQKILLNTDEIKPLYLTDFVVKHK